MNKKHREDNLLNTSISEFLLLFLFIFLAIASIHTKQLKEKTKIIEENQLIDLDEVAISKDDKKYLDSIKYEFEELNKAIVDTAKYSLVEKNDYTDYKATRDTNMILVAKDLYEKIKEIEEEEEEEAHPYGVPPACKIQGNDKLFTIELLPKYKLEITFKNLDEPIILSNYVIENNKTFKFDKSEFKHFGKQLHDSKYYNLDEEYCKPKNNPRWRNDSNCLLCIYSGDYVSSSKLFNKISENERIDMHNYINQYFYAKQIKK